MIVVDIQSDWQKSQYGCARTTEGVGTCRGLLEDFWGYSKQVPSQEKVAKAQEAYRAISREFWKQTVLGHRRIVDDSSPHGHQCPAKSEDFWEVRREKERRNRVAQAEGTCVPNFRQFWEQPILRSSTHRQCSTAASSTHRRRRIVDASSTLIDQRKEESADANPIFEDLDEDLFILL